MSIILGRSVQGFSHIRNKKPCQDWYEALRINNPGAAYDIIAVADGHGSLSCPYSGDGSRLAARTFCKLMREYCGAYDEEGLRRFINEKKLELSKKIVETWEEDVIKFHTREGREPSTGLDERQNILKQYGTTLLGILIAPSFVYSFRIGDGNMVYIDSDVTEELLEGDKILGVETWSMSSAKAWQKSHYEVRNFGESLKKNHMYMLTTDGFVNSYETDKDFYLTCQAYYQMFLEGKSKDIDQNLSFWLDEVSEKGCGDDITAVFAFYEAIEKEGSVDVKEESKNEMILGEVDTNAGNPFENKTDNTE